MDVSFSRFCDLLDRISRIQPRKVSSNRPRYSDAAGESQAAALLRRWRGDLAKPLDPRLGVIVFRLLFPEEDIRRRYGLKETQLAKILANVTGTSTLPGHRGEGLVSWDKSNAGSSSSVGGREGCLGAEIEKVQRPLLKERKGRLSLVKVEALLDELAAQCPWSNLGDASFAWPPRKPASIIRDLFSTLSPRESAFMTQIILKDLRPLLYPVPSMSTYSALLDYNSLAFDELSLHEAMRAWHWAMPRLYRSRASLDHVAALCAQLPEDPKSMKETELGSMTRMLAPEIGTPIDIPKALKGSGSCCRAATKNLKGIVWAETKMDGERAQIHIDTSKPYHQQIKVYSKSHRDSTEDRRAIHPIIRAALGLPCHGLALPFSVPERHISKPAVVSGVFEAEMTAQRDGRPGPFWRIAELKGRPGEMPKPLVAEAALASPGSTRGSDQESTQQTATTTSLDQPAGKQRYHLALYFFDVLVLNGESLLGKPYEERRAYLEESVGGIPDWAMFVPRERIDFDAPDAHDNLRSIFATHIADRHEGLVLKPAHSTYNDFRPGQRWIKMKRDYIDGLGDTADFVVIGAGYDKQRNRELRVSTKVFTAWYVGVCTNRAAASASGSKIRPHFEIIFRSLSYGLSRKELDDANDQSRARGGIAHASPKVKGLSFTFSMAPGLPKPELIFFSPFVFEMIGAGFQRHSHKHHWELRWPRITKRYQRSQRSWEEAVDLEGLDKLAKQANCVDAGLLDDEISGIWDDGLVSSEGYSADRAAWATRLQRADDEYVNRSRRSSAAKRSTTALTPRRLLSVPRLIATDSAPSSRLLQGRRSADCQKSPLATVLGPKTLSPSAPPTARASHKRRASEDSKSSPASALPSKHRKLPSAFSPLLPAARRLIAETVVDPDHPSRLAAEIASTAPKACAAPLPFIPPWSQGTGAPWFTTLQSSSALYSPPRGQRCHNLADLMRSSRDRTGFLFIDPHVRLLSAAWKCLINIRGTARITIHVYHNEALLDGAQASPEVLLTKYITCIYA